MQTKARPKAGKLSEDARKARAEYYASIRRAHPEREKIARARYWEKKAKNTYGDFYEPPKDGEEMSKQAVQIRRAYYKEHRKNHPEIYTKAQNNFFERKAKERT